MNRAGNVIRDKVELHFICKALGHHYSLKGLNRPKMYDTTLTQAPTTGKKKTPVLSKEEILGRNAEWGDPSSWGCSGVQWVPQQMLYATRWNPLIFS